MNEAARQYPFVKDLVRKMLSVFESAFGYFTAGSDLSSPESPSSCSKTEGHSDATGGEAISNGANFRHSTRAVGSPSANGKCSNWEGENGEATLKVSQGAKC